MVSNKEKNQIRLAAFNFFDSFGEKIKTKFTNVCSKTGQYGVPDELFQKRTPRSNRVLISWEAVKNNKLSMDYLKSFSGGVAVEFINNDFFDKPDEWSDVYEELKNKLGSDELVSSIISIRSESGSSSSETQRRAFNRLINNTKVNYNGNEVTINKNNYEDFAITQKESGGTGNEKWGGFLYVSIRGGQQDTIETHRGKELTIFNPACEFANEEVRTDLDLTVAYFAMLSIDTTKLDIDKRKKYDEILDGLKIALKASNYDSNDYCGNLLDYVESHSSVRMIQGQLTDPIQIKRIDIKNFSDDTRNSDSIDFTHNEAVVNERYYWDKEKKCILSPARPTNIFWSFHLSNMMQQDFDLDGYFAYEEQRYKKRHSLLNQL